MMQRVDLAITFPHNFSPILHSLLSLQRPNHTSLKSYCILTFQYLQSVSYKIFLTRTSQKVH